MPTGGGARAAEAIAWPSARARLCAAKTLDAMEFINLCHDCKLFTKQFEAGKISTFKPYSKYPPCFKDISFWLPDGFEPNDFFEIGREVCGELVEKMELVDEFTNPKKGKTSHCYRITYRSMERSLTDEEVNKLQETMREKAESVLKVELR